MGLTGIHYMVTSIFDHGPTSHHLATLLSFALEMPSIPRVIVCEPDVKCARYSTALYTVRITCIRKEDPKSHSGLCDRPHNYLYESCRLTIEIQSPHRARNYF